ncbi:hypothetical protein HYDPIDRAFT_93593 [Hydnomerulius pinastri MD-312]|uniref:BRCT domain-containing protein n=1 Tax=Hydnomerulius pinastri MD-312 TaxID=994086 RepID=A0A0C9VXH2_9AGAM|nr:hypothetical protein HYDPIDRAFT_93593 [Hydnomerulius pinastri MD-312]
MRRGNKSHKVPNVKLRPAQAPARHARDHNATWDHSSDSEMAPNASMVDSCPRPFKGITVCATGIVDKPTLFKQAFELGATSTSDFTDRVTHLIASTHGGAKYICALERKIPIMSPEWISEAYAIWLRGDDVDVEESVSKHRLSIFSGVILSLSGMEDIAQRTEVNRIVTAQQGTYVKNLERPVKVTHLLCSGDTETDKMRYAEKFNQRGEANIHLVWEEWFWDCLEFGGRFDERKYQVSRPRPERKPLLENSAPGSHRGSAIPVDNVPQLQPQPSKSLPPAPNFPVIANLPTELDEEEAAAVKRVPAVTLQLWKSLLKPRGFELEGGKLVRSPSKSQATRSPPSSPTRPRPPLVNYKGKEKESVISSFRRAKSFAQPPEPTIRQPFRRTTTVAALGPEDAEGSGLQESIVPEEESSTISLFTGYTFRLLGEARCPNVRLAIESGGGVVKEDDTDEVSFIIVRLISGSKLYRDEPGEYERSKYRTECWLEHSVFLERICEPNENISFTPLKISTPLPDAEQIHLSLSGLDQSELCWIRRLLRALGITLAPTFSRKSTHLLCPSGTGAKFEKALEWRIPVVTMEWLEGMARDGCIPNVNQYQVGGVPEEVAIEGSEGYVPEVRRDKGKGKEKAVDFQMADITNGGPPVQPMFAKVPGLLQDTALRDRVSTTLGDTHRQDSGQHYGLFGKPTGILSCDAPDNNHISSPPPPLPPQSSSPPLEYLPLAPQGPAPAAAVPIQPDLGAANHQCSGLLPVDDALIPSSKSPSPMKLPPSSSIPEMPPSPARPPAPNEAVKALQESLTSLLGKRPTSEEDMLPPPRKGKRARPQPRSKIQSRQESREMLGSPPRPAPEPEFEGSCYVDTSLFDGLRPTDESLRVTYEDPTQLEEKRRLMKLLGDPSDEPVPVNVGRKGRRGRMAGF